MTWEQILSANEWNGHRRAWERKKTLHALFIVARGTWQRIQKGRCERERRKKTG